MKARSEIDTKLDAAQEKRAGWRDCEDEKKTRSIKRGNEERDGDWRGESVATRSPSVESRSHSRRGKTPSAAKLTQRSTLE